MVALFYNPTYTSTKGYFIFPLDGYQLLLVIIIINNNPNINKGKCPITTILMKSLGLLIKSLKTLGFFIEDIF